VQEQSTNPPEEWRPIIGYEGWYEVSNLGRVKRVAPYIHPRNKLSKDGVAAIRRLRGIMSQRLAGQRFGVSREHVRDIWSGRRRSGIHEGRILRPRGDDYRGVALSKDGRVRCFSIHRLVATAFIRPPLPGEEANHKDGNGLNNSPRNLEWMSPSQNMRHALDTGLAQPQNPPHYNGSRNPAAKLTEQQVAEIRQLGRTVPQRELARRYDVGKSTIGRVQRGTHWRHVVTGAPS